MQLSSALMEQCVDGAGCIVLLPAVAHCFRSSYLPSSCALPPNHGLPACPPSWLSLHAPLSASLHVCSIPHTCPAACSPHHAAITSYGLFGVPVLVRAGVISQSGLGALNADGVTVRQGWGGGGSHAGH